MLGLDKLPGDGLHGRRFSNYWASCSNCGSRRSVLTGDWNTVNHIYGRPPCTTPPCPTGAETASASELPSAELLAAQGARLLPTANPDDYPTKPHYLTMPEANH